MSKKLQATDADVVLPSNPLNTVIDVPKRDVLKKRFSLPERCSCKSFVMRELIVADQREISLNTDINRTSDMDAMGVFQLQRKEAMKLAICAVDDRPVNVAGIPFTEFENWNYTTLEYVLLAYNDLNSGADDNSEDFLKGAEIVGGTPPAVQPAAATAG